MNRQKMHKNSLKKQTYRYDPGCKKKKIRITREN